MRCADVGSLRGRVKTGAVTRLARAAAPGGVFATISKATTATALTPVGSLIAIGWAFGVVSQHVAPRRRAIAFRQAPVTAIVPAMQEAALMRRPRGFKTIAHIRYASPVPTATRAGSCYGSPRGRVPTRGWAAEALADAIIDAAPRTP